MLGSFSPPQGFDYHDASLDNSSDLLDMLNLPLFDPLCSRQVDSQ